MLVRAVRGTTYLPLCSNKCLGEYLRARGIFEEVIADKLKENVAKP
jgi:hypothetical protein